MRASSLHIGAAAATAALREELVATGYVEPHDVDAAYAVSRITPGTNLLALYAVLGHRLGGWRLAVQAVAVGALVPASVALAVAALYTSTQSETLASVMGGARAGGIAVFLGAAVRLLRPQLAARSVWGAALAIATFVIAWLTTVNLFAILLAAGAVGAFSLRSDK